ncbi:MAG: hypothetical protein QXI59_01645 [Candidatus Bathyarchaeia archaeon]|nr:hypothetical protein [Candidatus Bathyarchaeota archaeon]
MVKVKTSIYTDKDLWEKYKRNLAKRGLEISKALEDLIKEDLVEDILDEALKTVAGADSYEIDFDPVKPRGGLASDFVRTMRNERLDNVS